MMKRMLTATAFVVALTAMMNVPTTGYAAELKDDSWRAEVYGDNFKVEEIVGETNTVSVTDDLVYIYTAQESCWMEVTSENSLDAYMDVYNTEGVEIYFADDIEDENEETISNDFRAVFWMEAGESYEFCFRSNEEDEKVYTVNMKKASMALTTAANTSEGVALTWAELPTWDIPTFAVLRKLDGESEWSVVGMTEDTSWVDATAVNGQKASYAVCGMDYLEETEPASLYEDDAIEILVQDIVL